MGKTKNKGRRGKADCPTGLPSVRDILKEEEEMCSDNEDLTLPSAYRNGSIRPTIKSIIDKLQSVSVEDKECACCTLATLAEQTEALPVILDNAVVKSTAPLVTDPSVVVRHAAVGALRNLSVCGDHDVCEAMVEQDVMTPLVALFKTQYAVGWQPQKPIEGKIDSVKEIFIDGVYLLCNLCESSSKAVRTFNKEQLVAHLVPCLNVEVYGQHVAIAVAQCLHTVSEDNAELVANLCQKENAEIVDRLLDLPCQDAGSTLLGVLGAGIIFNMNGEELSGCSAALLGKLMGVLSNALTVNAIPMVCAVVEKLQTSKERDTSEESLNWILSAQQVALEVLINICCSNGDGDNWEDVGSSDASDDVSCDDVDMEDDSPVVKFPLTVSAEVHERIISYGFMEKMLAKIEVPNEDVRKSLQKCEKGRKLYKKLLTLQCRALLGVNNLTTCLDVHDLGGPERLYSLWVSLGQLAFQQTGETGLELLEATTSAMSAILQKLAEIKSTQFEQFSLQDLQKLCELVQNAPDPRIRANGIRIIGNLGCLLGNSLSPNSSVLIKGIGTFLLDNCNKESELWVESEALDALFDVFAEDHVDPLLVELGIIEKLKNILPSLKHKINVQRKTLGEHLPIIMTAKTNLVRFINYKTTVLSGKGETH